MHQVRSGFHRPLRRRDPQDGQQVRRPRPDAAASGAGGNGGGSFNDCWASEWVRTFEGEPITERYGPLDNAQLSDPNRKGCRIGEYWGHTPDPEAGTSGVVLIKW